MFRIKVIHKGMRLFSEPVHSSPEVWALVAEAEAAGLLVVEVQRWNGNRFVTPETVL